jgi:predicted acetyltransferase
MGPNNTVLVFEVVGLDSAAERAIWEWIAGIDLVARIKGWRTPVPHPLFLGLHDIRRMGLTVGDGLWLRIVDVVAALEGRSYVGSGVVNLEVIDAFLPANAGRWRVEVTGGSATVGRTSEPADLALDTTDLATVYLGGFTFADLLRAGRVAECRPNAVVDADRLFATNAVAWCSTPF